MKLYTITEFYGGQPGSYWYKVRATSKQDAIDRLVTYSKNVYQLHLYEADELRVTTVEDDPEQGD